VLLRSGKIKHIILKKLPCLCVWNDIMHHGNAWVGWICSHSGRPGYFCPYELDLQDFHAGRLFGNFNLSLVPEQVRNSRNIIVY
jgi:hypothetical protein